MPPTRVATAMQGQIHPCHTLEPKSTNRASSVPVGQQAGSGLESLRSKKQHAEDIPPSGLPGIVITRGRKRDPSSCATSQVDCMASTLASVAEPIPDATERRPRKRHKRSSSTPATPRSSQLSAQLRSHGRSRSRAGSSTTDVEYVPPLRVSARLARKIHPFINSRSSDIYTHLADPDGAGNLLSEPPTASVTLSTNEKVSSQSAKKLRRRRRKTVDLADENAKKDLIDEWARMRQSQGAFPLSGIDENARFSQLDAITRTNSLGPDPVKSQTIAMINIPQSRETILDVSLSGSFSSRADFETALPGTDASREKTDHKRSALPSDDGAEQPIIPSDDIEASSTLILDPHLEQDSPNDEPTGVLETVYHLDLLQRPGSSSQTPSATPSQEDSVHTRRTKLTGFPMNEQTEAVSFNNPSSNNHLVPPSQMYSFDGDSIHLDSGDGFYMLDIPEIFTSPWVPVASHLYVPPSLGKLLSGMREQLAMEARARRRAEGLYQAELGRRISAEKIIEDLRIELEEREKDSSEGAMR